MCFFFIQHLGMFAENNLKEKEQPLYKGTLSNTLHIPYGVLPYEAHTF